MDQSTSSTSKEWVLMQYSSMLAHLKSTVLILISPRRKSYQPVLTKPSNCKAAKQPHYCKLYLQQKERTSSTHTTSTLTKSPCSPSEACLSLRVCTDWHVWHAEPLNLQLWDVVPFLQTGLMKSLDIGRQRGHRCCDAGHPICGITAQTGNWPFHAAT